MPWRLERPLDAPERLGQDVGVTDRFDHLGLVRMDEEACWQFLAQHNLGRVGLVHLASPMIFPVNYALDGQSVVFRTGPGTKLTLAAIGVRVAFEVDEADEAFESGTSVVVHGTLHEITDREELARALDLSLRAWATGDRDHFIRVSAERLTGRQFPAAS